MEDIVDVTEKRGSGPRRRSPAAVVPVRLDTMPVELARLKQVDLVRGVVNQLRQQIVAGRFPHDEPLPSAAEMCSIFGVSRTVVREAMRVLEAENLVEIARGRPPQVKPVDPQYVADTVSIFLQRGNHSLLQLVEVRRPLEKEIARLAAMRATPQQIEAMEEAIKQQVQAETVEEQGQADTLFHNRLAGATGNPVFEAILAAVAGLMGRSRRETLSRTGNRRALSGHYAVLHAVAEHDPDAAQKAMLDHLTWVEEDLRGAEA